MPVVVLKAVSPIRDLLLSILKSPFMADPPAEDGGRRTRKRKEQQFTHVAAQSQEADQDADFDADDTPEDSPRQNKSRRRKTNYASDLGGPK